MRNLQHPETGEHILSFADATADDLIEQGWEEIVNAPANDDEAAPAEPPTPPTPKADHDPDPGVAKAAEKPLGEMKLTELIEHAEKVGVTGEQLAALRKPGMSKVKAIDAINAHVSAAAAEPPA